MSKLSSDDTRSVIKFHHFIVRQVPILLAVIIGIFLVFPQQAQAQSFSFSTVQVQGNDFVDDGTILSYAGIARGSAMSAGELNDSYQAVLASGLFESVEFTPRGRTLVIRVTEFPRINRINVEGNARIDDETALSVVRSQPRRVFSPSQVEQDAAAITDIYQAQGRLTASVTPKIIKRTGNRVDVVFEVSEGLKVDVERISFVGNREYSDARLRRVLETKQAGFLRILIQRDNFVEDRIEFDKAVLRDFYLSRGYVDFQTTSVASEFSRERNAFFITFNILEGQSFDFGAISTVSDVIDVNPDDYSQLARIRVGETYSPTKVDNVIAKMERLAIQNGQGFLRVEPRITRNDRDLTLDVEFALVRGPRIFVERIDIEGNATTLDRVIRRQFRVVEGDPFNPREIRESAQRIRALGLFTGSDVNSRPGSSADQVILDVDVEEALTGSFNFGAAYNITTGIGLTGSYRERNFLGRGQTLNFDTTIGLDNSNTGLTFIEPAFLGRDLKFGFIGEYRQTEFDYTDYDTQSLRFEPSFEFPVSERGRLKLKYSLTNDSIFNVSADSSSVLQAEETAGELLAHTLGYAYSFDTRNSGLNPDAGVLLRFGQDFTDLENDTSFIKSTFTVAGETGILNNQLKLRATLEGGAIQSLGGGVSRLNDRFFLSSSKLRGFAPAGVGPRDLTVPNEDALGGNYYAVARFETEFPLGIPEEFGLTGGVFADIGSVWGLDNNAVGAIDDSMYLRSTVGFSLFWTTALGPLRFNFSKALEKQSYDIENTFDLTLSTQF